MNVRVDGLSCQKKVRVDLINKHTHTHTHTHIHTHIYRVRAFPVYVHYRLTEAVMHLRGLDQDEQNVIWDKLHNKHAPHMLELVKKLKGYYVKICQFSSSRFVCVLVLCVCVCLCMSMVFPVVWIFSSLAYILTRIHPSLYTHTHTHTHRLDILPHLWVETFAALQDDVPPKPADEIIRIGVYMYVCVCACIEEDKTGREHTTHIDKLTLTLTLTHTHTHTVEKSYGKPIDEVFEYFEADKVLGSASIGQCHMAKLKVKTHTHTHTHTHTYSPTHIHTHTQHTHTQHRTDVSVPSRSCTPSLSLASIPICPPYVILPKWHNRRM
jgi:hypothetical protein